MISMLVSGKRHEVGVDGEPPLQWVLREQLEWPKALFKSFIGFRLVPEEQRMVADLNMEEADCVWAQAPLGRPS